MKPSKPSSKAPKMALPSEKAFPLKAKPMKAKPAGKSAPFGKKPSSDNPPY
jgi:hypothetical protein